MKTNKMTMVYREIGKNFQRITVDFIEKNDNRDMRQNAKNTYQDNRIFESREKLASWAYCLHYAHFRECFLTENCENACQESVPEPTKSFADALIFLADFVICCRPANVGKRKDYRRTNNIILRVMSFRFLLLLRYLYNPKVPLYFGEP